VQRGFLGVSIQDVTSELAEKENIKELRGVFVQEVMDKSAAEKAGVKTGDIITKVNDRPVNSSSELQEEVGKFRPGQMVDLDINRKGKNIKLSATLLNRDGKAEPEIVDRKSANKVLGLVLENLSADERKKYDVRNGVRVADVEKGVFSGKITKGFIITSIDKSAVHTVSNAIALLENKKGGVLIEGKNAKGETEVIGVLIE
jgi:serine protease Do